MSKMYYSFILLSLPILIFSLKIQRRIPHPNYFYNTMYPTYYIEFFVHNITINGCSMICKLYTIYIINYNHYIIYIYIIYLLIILQTINYLNDFAMLIQVKN